MVGIISWKVLFRRTVRFYLTSILEAFQFNLVYWSLISIRILFKWRSRVISILSNIVNRVIVTMSQNAI